MFTGEYIFSQLTLPTAVFLSLFAATDGRASIPRQLEPMLQDPLSTSG